MGGTVMMVCGVAVAKLGRDREEHARMKILVMRMVSKGVLEFFMM
jgi:hypothetical protein